MGVSKLRPADRSIRWVTTGSVVLLAGIATEPFAPSDGDRYPASGVVDWSSYGPETPASGLAWPFSAH